MSLAPSPSFQAILLHCGVATHTAFCRLPGAPKQSNIHAVFYSHSRTLSSAMIAKIARVARLSEGALIELFDEDSTVRRSSRGWGTGKHTSTA